MYHRIRGRSKEQVMNCSCSGWYSSLLSSLYHSSNALANNNNILEGEGVKTEEIRDEDEEESDVRPQHQGEIQEMGDCLSKF